MTLLRDWETPVCEFVCVCVCVFVFCSKKHCKKGLICTRKLSGGTEKWARLRSGGGQASVSPPSASGGTDQSRRLTETKSTSGQWRAQASGRNTQKHRGPQFGLRKSLCNKVTRLKVKGHNFIFIFKNSPKHEQSRDDKKTKQNYNNIQRQGSRSQTS